MRLVWPVYQFITVPLAFSIRSAQSLRFRLDLAMALLNSILLFCSSVIATAGDSTDASPPQEAVAPPPEMAEMEDLGDSPSMEAERMRFAGRTISIRVLEAAAILRFDPFAFLFFDGAFKVWYGSYGELETWERVYTYKDD